MADELSEQSGPSGLNLGGVISEKLTEQIKNMDVMTVLQKMIANAPADEESEEIKQKLQGVIAQFNSMSDEDKAVFTAKIKEGLVSKISEKLSDPDKDYFGGIEEAVQTAIMNQLYLAAAVILVIIILIVFFGYKLYKSIKEKEVRKEEKKKLKQMKKKK